MIPCWEKSSPTYEAVNGIQYITYSSMFYVLKQSIAWKVRYDWLLKPRISRAIQLRATRAGFTPENVVIVAGTNELKSSHCVTLSHLLNIY